MAAYDFSGKRLFVEAALRRDAELDLERSAANYLLNVLRLGPGSGVLVFNGRDGEWRALLEPSGRKVARLRVAEQVRPQTANADLVLMFAPLKHARLDYLVQKAVEMGAGAIRPVFTRRTVPNRLNHDRMRANAIEAAEQCGVLAVPAILPDADLGTALSSLERNRLLVFCDEDAAVANPIEALRGAPADGGCAILIGPEGGFDPAEREAALSHPRVRRISLGPRILRADTAAVAALALVQAAIGDWR